MTNTNTAYQALSLIAKKSQKKGLFVSHHDDLHRIDRDTLDHAQVGDKYVWQLKECGTNMARVGGTKFSRESTSYSLSSSKCAVYLVEITGENGAGVVKPISADKARELLDRKSPLALISTLDNNYAVVDTSRRNAIYAQCTIHSQSARDGFKINVDLCCQDAVKRAREIEEAVSDGLVQLVGSLFVRIAEFNVNRPAGNSILPTGDAVVA
tara:strand:+ start:10011 stop:10643 length:633 start_codon:yes stop_codon:yes gene_type:complete